MLAREEFGAETDAVLGGVGRIFFSGGAWGGAFVLFGGVGVLGVENGNEEQGREKDERKPSHEAPRCRVGMPADCFVEYTTKWRWRGGTGEGG